MITTFTFWCGLGRELSSELSAFRTKGGEHLCCPVAVEQVGKGSSWPEAHRNVHPCKKPTMHTAASQNQASCHRGKAIWVPLVINGLLAPSFVDKVFSPLAAPFISQCHSEKLLCGHSLLIKSLVKLCTVLIFKAVHEMKKEYLPAQCIPRSLW